MYRAAIDRTEDPRTEVFGEVLGVAGLDVRGRFAGLVDFLRSSGAACLLRFAGAVCWLRLAGAVERRVSVSVSASLEALRVVVFLVGLVVLRLGSAFTGSAAGRVAAERVEVVALARSGCSLAALGFALVGFALTGAGAALKAADSKVTVAVIGADRAPPLAAWGEDLSRPAGTTLSADFDASVEVTGDDVELAPKA